MSKAVSKLINGGNKEIRFLLLFMYNPDFADLRKRNL